MHIVYTDESERKETYFIGALVVDSTAARRIESGLANIRKLLRSQVPACPPHIEFHAYDMFQQKGCWSAIPTPLSIRAGELVAKVLADSGARYVLRGINRPALESKYVHPHPIHELTLAHALEHVNKVLSAENPAGDALVVADDHHTHKDGRRQFRALRTSAAAGYSKAPLDRLIDTIYFGPSDHSDLLQAVDCATFFLGRSNAQQETDERASRVLSGIAAKIRSITIHEYIWVPA